MLNHPEVAGGEGGEGTNPPAGGGPQPGMEDGTIQVTAEEKQAIDRVSVVKVLVKQLWGKD